MSTIISILHTEKMSNESRWFVQGCTRVLAARIEPALVSHFCTLTIKPLLGFPHLPVIEKLSLCHWRFRISELINALALFRPSDALYLWWFCKSRWLAVMSLWRDNKGRQIKDVDSLTLSDKGRGCTWKHLLRFYRLLILFKQRVWKPLRGTLSC